MSLLSDLGSKRWWIISGLPGLAISFTFAANVQGFVLLVLAVCCIDIADSVAVGLSQATLIELSLSESTSTMARWTMFSSIGDLLAPLAVTTILSIGLGKPCQILLPGIVGFLAGQFGLLAGLAFLGSAPLWMLLLLPRT